MPYLWIGLIIFFVLTEVFTEQLVSIWLALGALGAMIVSLLTENYSSTNAVAVQIAVFVLVSTATLILTRPLVRKFTKTKAIPTNADRYIGEMGIVSEEINNLKPSGLVNAGGSIWTARSSGNEVIPEGAYVIIEKIEGVKLIVYPADTHHIAN